jgi:hypothetical protein
MARRLRQGGYGADISRMTHLWFRAKTYGWGWTPASIEGWLVMGVFLVGVVVDAVVLQHRLQTGDPATAWAVFFGVLAVLVAALSAICWLTGERPRWHWGD